MSSAPVSPAGGNPALTGKIALITGAYGDIGQHTVLGLARAGATVIAAGRDPVKLALLAQSVTTQVPGAQIETLVLDLANLDSVQQAAQTALATARRLDVLVNNAAVMPGGQRRTTRDGFELAFGTNHLGHYALTGHLLPALLTPPGTRDHRLRRAAEPAPGHQRPQQRTPLPGRDAHLNGLQARHRRLRP